MEENNGSRQLMVLGVTITYFFIELIGGLRYHSIALVTDASFMAVNVSGQLIALWVMRLAHRAPDEKNTFGYERAKVLSSLFNGVLVGFILFYVFIEAIHKLRSPHPIETDKVLIIAIMGLAANGFGLLKLAAYSGDANIRGAMLLLLNDTLGSVGVILAAVLIRYTGLWFFDPLAGILIGCLAAYPTYLLVRGNVKILMEGNPSQFSSDDVTQHLLQNFAEIQKIKDIRIWGLSPEKLILVARIRTNGSVENHRTLMKKMKRNLIESFGFHDVYLEGYEKKIKVPHLVSISAQQHDKPYPSIPIQVSLSEVYSREQ